MVEIKRYSAIDQQGKPALITIASGPVIVRGREVLLDKHGDDEFWKFPGGGIQDNESWPDTARREAKEELGLDVQLQGEPLVLCFTRERDGLPETVILIHYLATTKDEPKAGRDVREFAWHSLDALPADCAPNIKPVMAHFRQRESW